MNYATNFAIVEDGIVTNIAWGMVYSMQQEYPNAVQIGDMAVRIGDAYSDGVFTRDGAVVEADNLTVLSQRITELETVIDALVGGTA